jgi:tetratricopeptide (TPR) repeat protein
MMAALTAHTVRAEKMTCAETRLPLASLEMQLKMMPTRAAICVREGKPLRAVALMTRLIGHKPTDPIAYLNRGNAYAAAGEVAQAIGDYTTAIHLNSELAEAWYNRGTTYMHLRRFDKAVNDFTEAVRLKPDSSFALCNRGFAYFQIGDYDRALADYIAGVKHSAGPSFCYLNRGTLYLALGEYQKAIADFSQVIGDKPITQVTGDRPAGAVALGRRGQAYEAMGEACRALDDYRAALEAYPRLEAAREGFARIKTKQRLANGHP